MIDLTFQWPSILALLILTIPLVWLLKRARNKRHKVMQALGGGFSKHRKSRDTLRTLSFILLILSLARPGYAPQAESVSRAGRDVVIAIDVSQSMLAEDLSPSRLEVAKQGVRDMLATFENQRVALVVYAGSASILCPLTYDYDFVSYMLEQVNTRSVEFGGTALQSAIEKSVDQVFIDNRENVQDLIILTDGGDHQSQTAKIVALIEEKEADVLLVGLGDPKVGSVIPIIDNEGKRTSLEYNNAPVLTKLADAPLRILANQSKRISYQPVGMRPFNLGQLYLEYAAGRNIEAADSQTGITVYQEAAIFFLIPCLILLILSEYWGALRSKMKSVTVSLLLTSLCLPSNSQAAAETFEASFDQATELLNSKKWEDAADQFTQLYDEGTEKSISPRGLAAVQFNRGLCLIQLAESTTTTDLSLALNNAQNAQLAFLTSKRCSPELHRAGIRLELTSSMIMEIKLKIEEKRSLEDQINQQIQKLIEQLEILLAGQLSMLQDAIAKDPQRGRKMSSIPEDAPANSAQFVQTQKLLIEKSKEIQQSMHSIDAQLKLQLVEVPNIDTLMTEPLKIMGETLDSQAKAATHYLVWNTWPEGLTEQKMAISKIKKIIELLNNSSQDSPEDSDEYEEMEEDEDDSEYTDEDQEAMSSSDAAQGDLASGSEMQELPVPNYSADDILLEEQGSLQFRQQKRADANANKVEKDF